MQPHTDQLIVVTGAAGNQGGAVARHLLAAGWKVRALTRDPEKPTARALAEQGAELFNADNDNRASLDAAFQGAYGVFSVQNFWLPGVGAIGEVHQGKAIAEAAREAGVRHFVYSSVGAAHRGMGQEHFDSKFAIEQFIKLKDLPYTILRPAYFMENLFWRQAQILEGTYTGMGLRPDKGVQMIAVDDIGAFAALAFANRPAYLGSTLELAGDELTEVQIAATLAKVIGRPVELINPPPAPANAPSPVPPERQAMFRFFNSIGYDADITALRRIYPELKTFEQWLHETGWGRGDAADQAT